MSEYKMCVKCLSHYEADKAACPFCGSENINTNPTGALALGTVLGSAYTVGEFREIDGEGVVYTGVDNARKRRVMIKEFMPVTLCAGRHADGTVKPKEGSEVLFKTAMMDFSEVYTTLINMGPVPALAQVFDLISSNGTAYAVTEYPTGEKLEAYLAHYEGALDWRDAMMMLEPVCIAVEKLHRLGWIHRGISPENITITAEGEAKLSGYATMALRTAHSEFKPQQYPGYTAPEQYSVREYQGAYTDIYALGAVLYRTITGETPPPARERQLEDALTPAGELVKVPKFISVALTRALRLDSASRFQTVLELREALADTGRPAPVPAGSSKMKKLIENNRVAVYIIAGVVGMIVVISLLWLVIRSVLPAPKDSSSLPDSSMAVSDSISGQDNSGSSSSAVSSAVSSWETYINLPSFVGMPYTEVQTQYGRQIRFELKEEYHETYAVGEVISQSPLAGSTYTEGSVVTLTISKGSQKVPVPNILNLSRESAVQVLNQDSIRFMFTEVENDGKYEEGVVLRTDPETGTMIDVKNTTVNVYITGKKPVVSSTPDPDAQPPASSVAPPTPSSSGETADSNTVPAENGA